MRSSFHVLRRLRSLVLLLAASSIAVPMVAQEPGPGANPGATRAVVALGENLFKDTRLSSTGSMSCASCHLPDRAFTEDKPHAIGQTGAALGRNTPTLLGLGSVKAFPVGGSFASPPTMVALEERVVVPLRDLAEMNGTVGGAIDRLSKDPACIETFNAAFEEPGTEREPAGVTGDRMAAALAAYVRSLRLPESPSLLALAGSNLSLDESVGRGVDVFRNEGRCQTCHSGPGLTDGQLYVVSQLRLPTIPKAKHQSGVQVQVKAASIALEAPPTDTRPNFDAARVRRTHRTGGGYGQTLSPERQTLTLLDVQRTAPYFRDGSAASLSDAVRRHVAELREVGARRTTILENPTALFSERALVFKNGAAKSSLSVSAKEQLSSDGWIPADLTSQQLDDLVALLTSFSPS